MYLVEGLVRTKELPEVHLGRYGFVYKKAPGSTVSSKLESSMLRVTSSRKGIAKRTLNTTKRMGLIPRDSSVKVEKISTVEQAEGYILEESTKPLKIEFPDKPNINHIDAHIRNGEVVDEKEVLIGATARLWTVISQRTGIIDFRTEMHQIAQWAYDTELEWIEQPTEFVSRTITGKNMLGITIVNQSVSKGWES